MCSSIRGNERSSIFFDHMASASSLHQISEIYQKLKALSVYALSLSLTNTRAHMHMRSFGMSSACKCVIKSNITQTLRCFLPPQKARIKNIHAAQISGLASLPSLLQLTPKKVAFSASSFHPSAPPLSFPSHHLSHLRFLLSFILI